MSYRYLILALALFIPAHVAFAGDTVLGQHCDLKPAFGASNKSDFLNFDATLREALQSSNSTAVALLVSYPLFVNVSFPITVPNAWTLQDHFQEIFTPAVRNAVLNQDIKNMVCATGLTSYYDGKAMITVKQVSVGKSKEFRISGISLIPNPKSLLTNTRHIMFICHTPTHNIVVDGYSYQPARYRAWNRPHTPFDKPDLEINGGQYDGGGTQECAHLSWIFKNGNTQYAVSQPSCAHVPGPQGSIGFVGITIGDKPVETLWCYN